MCEYVASIDPDHPDWIRWTALREDVRQGAHERDVEHAVFVLLRVLQERYPEPVVDAGLTPETVLDALEVNERERRVIRERLARDSVLDEPVDALPERVRSALVSDQETSG